MDNPSVVLLVEDDPVMSDLVSLVLDRNMGLQVITATNGQEALSLFQEHQPGIVILDILLPHMNGLELLRRLNEQKDLDRTHVIVTSALGYQEIVKQAVEAGAKDFLVKPFNVEDLVQRVSQALGKDT